MGRCRYGLCQVAARYNHEHSKSAAYCKKHAEDSMVKKKMCSHDSCTRQPCFNVTGSNIPVYCKQHVEDGMVNVKGERCPHDSCMRQPSFNDRCSVSNMVNMAW